MKKLIYLFLTVLIVACSSDDGNTDVGDNSGDVDNPCLYNPTLTTSAVTNVTETSATLNGVISIVSENCEEPTNTEQGFVYATTIQPTIANTQVNVDGTDVSITLENLEPNTTYYVRTFLTNTLGEFYGNEVSFITIDEDEEPIICNGNLPPSIVYGTQEWTVENTCITSYRDGTPIPEVTDLQEFTSLTTGAWCYFDNDPTKTRLYNWFAIVGLHDNDPNTPLKEFAPEGWRVPSDNDWEVFLHYLQSNGYNLGFPPDLNRVAKSLASTTGWINTNGSTHPGNNQSSNNSSGFNAYPFGVRIWNNFDNGGFVAENVRTTFWSNRQNNDDAKVWSIYAESSQLENFYSRKKNAYSVRFIRD